MSARKAGKIAEAAYRPSLMTKCPFIHSQCIISESYNHAFCTGTH